MTESAGYLLEDLPIGQQVVRDAQYLGDQNNGESKGVLAIKGLYYNICRTLNSDTLKKIFNRKNNDSTDSLIDAVTEEFKLCQLERIPSFFYEVKPKKRERCIPIGNRHMVYWMWQQPILTMIQNIFV